MRKPIIIIGGGHTVLDDWKYYTSMFMDRPDRYCDIGVVNDQIYTFQGRVDYFFTLHGEKMEGWFNYRESKVESPEQWSFEIYCHRSERWKNTCHDVAKKDFEFNTTKYNDILNYEIVNQKWEGSSGLYAVQNALELGYEKILLCGIPMDIGRNIFRPRKWKQGDKYWNGWLNAYDTIKNNVRSPSGRTSELLGKPDMNWIGYDCLNSENPVPEVSERFFEFDFIEQQNRSKIRANGRRIRRSRQKRLPK